MKERMTDVKISVTLTFFFKKLKLVSHRMERLVLEQLTSSPIVNTAFIPQFFSLDFQKEGFRGCTGAMIKNVTKQSCTKVRIYLVKTCTSEHYQQQFTKQKRRENRI